MQRRNLITNTNNITVINIISIHENEPLHSLGLIKYSNPKVLAGYFIIHEGCNYSWMLVCSPDELLFGTCGPLHPRHHQTHLLCVLSQNIYKVSHMCCENMPRKFKFLLYLSSDRISLSKRFFGTHMFKIQCKLDLDMDGWTTILYRFLWVVTSIPLVPCRLTQNTITFGLGE